MNEIDYVEFMFDRSNEMQCDRCPENSGCSNWQYRLPCGQQNCWVTVHCDHAEQQED